MALRLAARRVVQTSARGAGSGLRRAPRRMFSSSEGGGGGMGNALLGGAAVLGIIGIGSHPKVRGIFFQTGEEKVETMRRQSLSLSNVLRSELTRELGDYTPEKMGAYFTEIFSKEAQGGKIPTANISKIKQVAAMQALDPSLDVGAIFDRDSNGTVDLKEFIYGFVLLGTLTASKFQSDNAANRAAIGRNMFVVIDNDNDGQISMEELQSWISSARAMGLISAKVLFETTEVSELENLKENKAENPRSDAEVAKLLMAKFDIDHNNTISQYEFLKLTNSLDFAHFFA